MFALFYYIIDVRKITWWTTFFVVIGMNSITIYMAQKMINFTYTANFFFSGLIKLSPDNYHKFLSSAAYVAICWLFLYILYRKKIFLKV